MEDEMNKTRFLILAIIVGLIFSQLPPILATQAQDETMIRFYIVPIEKVVEPGTPGLVRKPKYIHDMDARWGLKDYGMIDIALIGASVTQAQHEQIASEIDVIAAPQDIDQNISEIALPQVKDALEQMRIPVHWVTTDYTYRQILRRVAGLFSFAQRYHGMHYEELIDNQAQLDLRWNEIPQERQDKIKATADNLGYDYSEVTNQWTIRQILKLMADQSSLQEYNLNGAIL